MMTKAQTPSVPPVFEARHAWHKLPQGGLQHTSSCGGQSLLARSPGPEQLSPPFFSGTQAFDESQ